MRYVECCEQNLWHLEIWRKDCTGERRRVPFRCRSWRHPGECSQWKGAQDFARCKVAISSRPHWVYVVLTYDPVRYPSRRHVFETAVRHWSMMRQRITRKYGRFDYLQTWEVHRSGWPHVNVLLHNTNLFNDVDQRWQEWRKRWLEPVAVDCGFGKRTWVELMHDADGMAGYFVKLCRELTGAGGKSQVPINAPRHFRRLRASRGLLPPIVKDDELTGTLHQCPSDHFDLS